MAEKMRVHTMAKALNVTSKDILEKCRAEGIDVKNHMSTLGPGLEATVREWFSDGAHTTTIERARRVDLKKVRKKRAVKRVVEPTEEPADEASSAQVAVVVAEAADETELRTETPPPTEAEALSEPIQAEPIQAESIQAESIQVGPDQTEVAVDASTEAALPAVLAEGETPTPAAETGAETASESKEDAAALRADSPAKSDDHDADETLKAEDAQEAGEARKEKDQSAPMTTAFEPVDNREPVSPAGPQNVPAPAKLTGPRVVRYEAPEEYTIPRRGRRPRPAAEASPGGTPSTPGAPPAPGEAPGGRGARGKRPGEQDRGARRGGARRRGQGAQDAGEKLNEWNNQDLAERQARLRGATGRRMQSRRATQRHGGGGHQASPITEAKIQEPIMLKELCSTIGIPFQRMFPILTKEHNLMPTLASIIPKGVAEMVAENFGVELTVTEAKTGLDRLIEEHAALERKNLKLRPPIVTVLGHVDHGKTSLLDHIRNARVANREDGGITQHISSYHYKKDDVAVTFLDTPGHAAFTALRARGAKLTDIVILVVAADDGVMPQTIEAINHAKAADVPIVVALNKIDLGTQNVTKIYTQLTERDLTPSGDWGGQVDVIHTSASTGEGVDDLLEHLSTLAEVHEYKADTDVPATGTVVEAESRQGVGPVLQVIVSEGTVKVGDVLVCGNAYGKVRALHDDTGKSVRRMGPSMPVEIWGLNEVPSSGDRFFAVANTQKAKEIAEEIKNKRRIDARSSIKKARSLDDLVKQRSDASTNELQVIVKADVDGSVGVLAETLTQFPSDEVKLNVLHAAIGAVTDSDVHLADASNAIIVAFRVTAPGKTKRLAEEKGVDIRQYKVIYDVTADIKKALEGLLVPDEVIESRGSLEVREVFRITKVGLVAGSYVREGTVATSHLSRVVRDGVLVRDNCKFDSIRRFKDSVKEVRNGMECGVRLEGFDDIKIGDVIETYEIIKVARTLD